MTKPITSTDMKTLNRVMVTINRLLKKYDRTFWELMVESSPEPVILIRLVPPRSGVIGNCGCDISIKGITHKGAAELLDQCAAFQRSDAEGTALVLASMHRAGSIESEGSA